MDTPELAAPRTFGERTPLFCLVIAAIVIGTFLRIDGVNRKSLWIDEVLTYQRASQPTAERVLASLEATPLAPLYYLALWTWVRLWGLSDTSLRTLPVVLGLITLPTTYLVWRPLVGRRAASFALALVALSAYHIWYSQDAKMYAAVWLLATVSCGTFLNVVLTDDQRIRWPLLYGISTALLPMVSYTGASVIFIQGLYGVGLFTLRPHRRRRLIVSAIVLVLAMIPSVLWLPIALGAIQGRYELSWIPPTSVGSAPKEIVHLFGVFLVGYHGSKVWPTGLLEQFLSAIYLPCVLGSLALLAHSLFRVIRPGSESARDRDESRIPGAEGLDTLAEVLVFLATWLILPILACLVYSVCAKPLWGVPRYLIGSAPALTLWFATALSRRRESWLATALLATVLVVNFAMLELDRTKVTRADWRATVRSLGTVGQTLDAVEPIAKPTPRESTPARFVAIDDIVAKMLDHAARTEQVAIERETLKTAIERGRAFFVVAKRGPDAPAVNIPPGLGPAGESFRHRRLASTAVYEDWLSPTVPSPFQPYWLDVWVCLPSEHPADRSLEARAGR
jgi:uncharacterized membrane protein